MEELFTSFTEFYSTKVDIKSVSLWYECRFEGFYVVVLLLKHIFIYTNTTFYFLKLIKH